ncbi:MAG: hypothetical protein AB7P76_05620 [Candidatus Melainabacteria bacterium]
MSRRFGSTKQIQPWHERVLGMDPRAWIAFRLGLGVALIWNLVTLWPDLSAFYTDQGIWPVGRWWQAFRQGDWLFSLHALSGALLWQQALWVLSLVAAVLLAAGWRTGWLLPLNWLLLISLQNRFETIAFGGDTLLRMLLFWSFWMGYALPVRRHTAKNRFSLGAIFIKCQVLLMYWVTVALKSGPEWFPDGTALIYAFQADHIVMPGGAWLLSVSAPELLQLLTAGAWLLEWLAPVGLLMPWPWVRMTSVLLLMLLHGGILLTLNVHWFPLVNIVALIPFIPTEVWDVFRFPVPRPFRLRVAPSLWLKNAWTGLALSACVLVLWVNLASLSPAVLFPGWASSLARVCRLDQYWGMFAPHPMKKDGWYLIKGKRTDGAFVDVLSGRAFLPADVPGRVRWQGTPYTRFRWQKYLEDLIQDGTPGQYQELVRYWCEQNTTLKDIAVFYRQSPLDSRPAVSRQNKAQYYTLGRYACR